MGVAPNKTFTFDGVSSSTYGVYLTSEGVFNAPERDVEMVEIPGRNGNYALDHGKFKNITVTYKAGIVDASESNFADKMSAVRNWLCSKVGYKRLSDDYNANEYRMAVFKSGVTLDHVDLRTGEFDITFDCKPQRWLTSGETAVTIGGWGETETASGEIATFEADSATEIKTLTADIEPIQDTSGGDPSPTNICPISGHDDVTITVADDVYNPIVSNTYTTTLPSTTYGGTLDLVSGVLTVTHAIVDMGNLTWDWVSSGSYFTADVSGKAKGNTNMVSSAFKVVSTQAANMNDGEMKGNPNNNTIYLKWALYNGDKNALTSALSGQKLVYERATPTTTTLTPQQVQTLLGTNNVWADSGDVTVEYRQNLSVLINPTPFEAEPLLAVDGYGTIGFNGYEIEINNETMGSVVLWDDETVNSTSIPRYNTRTMSSMIPTGYLNTADTFSLYGFSFQVSFGSYFSKSSPTVNSVTASHSGVTDVSTSASYELTTTSRPEDGDYEIKFYLDVAFPTLQFVYGTPSTFTDQQNAICTYTFSVTSTLEIHVTTSVVYDGDRTVTYNWECTNHDVTYTLTSALLPKCVGESTVIISSGITYIDCDIGEAYKIDNGEIVSLNNYITLGSDLPKLSSGTNTFTYDNTVTELKVTPRWWKV